MDADHNCKTIRQVPCYSELSQNTQPILPVLMSGLGARVRDSLGREYIDCCAQTLNANLGQCHPDIVAAVESQAHRLTCASSRFGCDVAMRLHERLVSITPRALNKVNLSSCTGSLANECALKAARKKTGRSLIFSLHNSHLGQSFETMRTSGKHFDATYLGDRRTQFFPAPHCYRCPFGKKVDNCSVECLDDLEHSAAQPESAAAVIIEPIMVDAGVVVPPQRYHRRLHQICKDRSIPLIWDEIQTAFGWLGQTFAMDLFSVVPDFLSLGKALGAGFPLAATLFNEKFDVLEYGEHEMTSGAHPVACAASLAMLDVLQRRGFLSEVRRKGEVLRYMLTDVRERHPSIGDVRAVGLLAGIEFIDWRSMEPAPSIAQRVFRSLLEHGVLTRVAASGGGNVLQVKPPLVITDQDLCEFVMRLEKAVTTAET